MEAELEQASLRLGVQFRNPELLRQALTHRSWSNESGITGNNETLEFLGDAVLDFIIAEHVFTSNPDADEGLLSRLKSIVVSERTLASVAERLGIGELLFFGRGELVSGGSRRSSNLANAFEAILGAIYLDSGMTEARQFALRHLESVLSRGIKAEKPFSPRTELQEYVQKRWHRFPEYFLVAQSPPDKDNLSVFTVEVHVNEKLWGRGDGHSKKEACRKAAENALERHVKPVSDSP
ncbi:MAG TPA: ribonuclease III [Spirochaetota bacterium]|nr:ribonuclease III [Spirochaetota bacterium]HPN82958.1 ribonuclease III [Spirochaetota bacterium]